VLKDQDDGGETVGKNWVDGEVPPHCSKRRIGALICQKCKKKKEGKFGHHPLNIFSTLKP
jgi:hypothetical protein